VAEALIYRRVALAAPGAALMGSPLVAG
jgi:hypothetical protein